MALNIVPNRARFDFEIRNLPGQDPDVILARLDARRAAYVADLRQRFPEAAITVEITNSYPALDTAPDSDVVNYVKSLTGGNSTGKIAFGTEGGLFQNRLGIPTVVCGPGSIAVAHKPDEYIAESEMAACDRMLGKLLEGLAG